MSNNQFSALLAVITPEITALITKNSNITETQAISLFYRSKLYKELANESSKLWHSSPLTLYTMLQDELLSGGYV